MNKKYLQTLALGALAATTLQADASEFVSRRQHAPVTTGDRPVNVLIELQGPAAAVVWGERMKAGMARDNGGTAAARAAANQALANDEEQRRFLAAAATTRARTQWSVLFRVQKALNAIALTLPPGEVEQLRSLAGVRSVRLIEPEYPSAGGSVRFIGAPQVWSRVSTSLPRGVTGRGVRVGVIDSGIDYQHADFGGSGRLGDYQANDRTQAPDPFFPTAKVVGGWDFVGDDYDGGNAPVPDPDPMDCDNHGTHVAGILAGYGVNADGTSYAGPWNDATQFGSMRIAPGVAPEAQLYALRIIGCSGGSTSMAIPAIDWALDPDQDNDLSDHLDLINLSIGIAHGIDSISPTTRLALDNATRVGVIAVAGAGNNGDSFHTNTDHGEISPVITVAASKDDEMTAPFLRVDTPPALAGVYSAGATLFNHLPDSGLRGTLAVALDPADTNGASIHDACSPLTNGAVLAGHIALIDRSDSCPINVQARHAQQAGAIGALIVHDRPGAAPNFSISDPTVTIPVSAVTLDDGNLFKAGLPVQVTLYRGADAIGRFSSRGPASSAVLKPDLAAPGVNIASALSGVTCVAGSCYVPDPSGYLPGNRRVYMSGTSMAAPHVAGMMALLRQLHPGWSVEELKALAMNTAVHDLTPGYADTRLSASRVGAGRVDLARAAAADVVAYNAQERGAVSMVFDSNVTGSGSQTKRVRIVNHGTAARSYDLRIDTVLDAPGIGFALPGGGGITVPAGGSIEIDVRMDADSGQMRHTMDPTLDTTQTIHFGTQLDDLAIPRAWITEESAYLDLVQSGSTALRVPLYTVSRPASQMRASAPAIATGGTSAGSADITLIGNGLCTGSLNPDGTCEAPQMPVDRFSLLSAFELQVVSSRNPAIPAFADIRYAGVTTDGDRLFFGIATFGEWSTPNAVAFNIQIDSDGDGSYDRIITNSSAGMTAQLFGATIEEQPINDALVTLVMVPGQGWIQRISEGVPNYPNAFPPDQIDTQLMNSNVIFLGARPEQLGLADLNAPFRYRVQSCPGAGRLCTAFQWDQSPWYDWSAGGAGVGFPDGFVSDDLPGRSVPVQFDSANLAANGSQGVLLLHHFNKADARAEVLPLEGTATADLAVDAQLQGAGYGREATLTLGVTDRGPNDAAAVIGALVLPGGLAYVSDDGGGAYDAASGIWSIGTLANGAGRSLHVTVRIDTTDRVCARFSALGTPLDHITANDQASACSDTSRPVDVTATKTVSGDFAEGGEVTYTIVLRNAGVAAQPDNPGDELTDVLPPDLSLLRASASSGTIAVDLPANTVHWNGAIAAGASVAVTIAAQVKPGTQGRSITNQATVRFDMDGDGVNETSAPSLDPAGGGTSFQVGAPVPALTDAALAALAALVAALGAVRRRRTTGH